MIYVVIPDCGAHVGYDNSWDFISPQLEDQDGSLSLADTILQFLSQLVYAKSSDTLTEGETCTMNTLVHILFDLYLQSEITLKHAIAKMFGDNYIRCLIDINEIVHNFLGKLFFLISVVDCDCWSSEN